MKVHFLNVRTMHHSAHSGYDRFMDYITNSPIPGSRRWQAMPEQERERAYQEAKSAISWYNPPDLEMETDVNALSPWLKRHICHFLYGENSVFHIQRSTNSRKKIFVSFHQPPEAHQQFIRTRAPLQSIDGIVVVGTNQIPFFEQYVPREKIHFVPHGIDIDFFKPAQGVRQENRILFVGNWLRDFETLVAVSKILAARAPGLKIDVVTLERNRPFFDGCCNIAFHSGIPEADLLRKYQEASLLMVPMKDCTANNSVLEGMACGLPIVTTAIGGITDYVDGTCSLLCRRGDAEEMAKGVLDLLHDEGRRNAMGAAARARAARFAWPEVAQMLTGAYRKAFAGKC